MREYTFIDRLAVRRIHRACSWLGRAGVLAVAIGMSACDRRAEGASRPSPRANQGEISHREFTGGALAPVLGDSQIDREIRAQQDLVRQHPRDARGYLALAERFV